MVTEPATGNAKQAKKADKESGKQRRAIKTTQESSSLTEADSLVYELGTTELVSLFNDVSVYVSVRLLLIDLFMSFAEPSTLKESTHVYLLRIEKILSVIKSDCFGSFLASTRFELKVVGHLVTAHSAAISLRFIDCSLSICLAQQLLDEPGSMMSSQQMLSPQHLRCLQQMLRSTKSCAAMVFPCRLSELSLLCPDEAERLKSSLGLFRDISVLLLTRGSRTKLRTFKCPPTVSWANSKWRPHVSSHALSTSSGNKKKKEGKDQLSYV